MRKKKTMKKKLQAQKTCGKTKKEPWKKKTLHNKKTKQNFLQ